MLKEMQQKRGLKADLSTLFPGELAYCTDTKELYIGSSEGNQLIGRVNFPPDEIKTLYESNANTNAYTDAEKAKLGVLPEEAYSITEVETRLAEFFSGFGVTDTDLTPIALTNGQTLAVSSLAGKDRAYFVCRNIATGELDTDSVPFNELTTGTTLLFFDNVNIKITIDATNITFVDTVTGYNLKIYGVELKPTEAYQIEYDNLDSGLEATEVQAAIDEVNVKADNAVPYTGAVSDVDLGEHQITAKDYFGDISKTTGRAYRQPSFQIYNSSSFYVKGTKEEYRLRGNFTAVNRRKSSHQGLANRPIHAYDDLGNSIRIVAEGYTFIVEIKLLGVVAYHYACPTVDIFSGPLTDTDQVITTVVDYDKLEIRISASYGVTPTTFSAAELKTAMVAIKDVYFNNIYLGIANYNYLVKYSFVVNGIFDYNSASYNVLLNPDRTFPSALVKSKGYRNVVASTPTGITISVPSLNKPFVDGKLTFTYAELAARTVQQNNYLYFLNYVKNGDYLYGDVPKMRSLISYEFECDVVGDPIYLRNNTTCIGITCRLIERNTGEVIEYHNPSYWDVYTLKIPEGQWKIKYLSNTNIPAYNIAAIDYTVGWGDVTRATDWLTATEYVIGQYVNEGGSTYRCLVAHTSGVFSTDLSSGKWELGTPDSTWTIYDNHEIYPMGIMLSAFPEFATFGICECPFSEQSAYGYWLLGGEYE